MSDREQDVKALDQCIEILENLYASQAERVSRMLAEYFRRMDFTPSPHVHTAAGGVWDGER